MLAFCIIEGELSDVIYDHFRREGPTSFISHKNIYNSSLKLNTKCLHLNKYIIFAFGLLVLLNGSYT